MTDRKRRAIDIGLLTLALIGIFSPLVIRAELQDRRTADQEAVTDWLAKRDDAQADLIADLAEVTAQREVDRLAFEMAACLYGNHAKRIARADADVAISVLIDGLRMSPHGDLADQIEADIRSRMSTAASSDHDCDGDGVIGDPGDYP